MPSRDALDLGRTLWAETAPPAPQLDELRDDLAADAVIVGGGYTGLSCALHLAEAGYKAVLLEARVVGWGGSGRNAGQWIPGWAGQTPRQIEARFGGQRGRALNRLNLEATRLVPELIERHGIDASMSRRGIALVAQTESRLAQVRQAADDWAALGAECETLGREEIGNYVNSQRYRGGVIYRDAGTLNPLAYARGLARAAAAKGAAIHTHSPAISVDSRGLKWRVRTEKGSVEADRLAICTNAYGNPGGGGPWPGLDKTYYRLRLAMLASAPLPDKGRAFAPAGIPFNDADPRAMFGGMLDPDGRFVASTLAGLKDDSAIGTVSRSLDAKFRRAFPGTPPPPWRHLWLGDICLVPDRVPKFYRLATGAVAALGYSGAGIALATMYGRELAGFLFDGQGDHSVIPVAEPKRLPGAAIVPRLFRYLMAPLSRGLGRFI